MSEATPTRQNPTSISRTIKQIIGSKYIKLLLVLLQISTGLLLLLLAVRQVQWGNLALTIRSADIVWLSAAFVSVLTGLGLKYWRWGIIMKNYQVKAGAGKLFRAFFVGQAVNIVLPFRGGELIRIGYFSDQPGDIPQVASSIVLEKYLDLLALTITASVVSMQISLNHILDSQGWLLPLTTVLTILFLVAILTGPRIWVRLRSKHILPDRSANWIDKWIEASLWLRYPARILPSILMTVLIWVAMWLTNLLLFRSLGMPLGATAAGLVLILVYLGLIPALMPGNLGPFYFFAQLAVMPFGIIQLQALSYAVILHFIVTTPSLVIGAVSMLSRYRPKTTT